MDPTIPNGRQLWATRVDAYRKALAHAFQTLREEAVDFFAIKIGLASITTEGYKVRMTSILRGCVSDAQVSVRPMDANLGHPAIVGHRY